MFRLPSSCLARRHSFLSFFGTFPLSPLSPCPLLVLPFFSHFLCYIFPSSAQSPPPFIHPNPLPGPCHLPNPSSSASLSPFCQFHYHQMPYICDPAGILSRTEAELIDRRLHGILTPFAPPPPLSSSSLSSFFLHSLNVTGCFCDASSAPTALRRQCFVYPAWKDKKLGQIRIAVLLTPRGSINSIRKCAKSMSDKWQQKRNGNGETVAKQRHKREAISHGFSYATALFVRSTLKRMLSSENARQRCDPDLLIVYILGWSGSSVPMPFVARLFRRNLAHLAHKSQMERVNSAEGGAFEVISDQLVRAVQLVSSTLARPSLRSATTSPLPVVTLAQFVPLSANPRTEQIPLWAILSSIALLTLALIAVLLAHWVGRRISASHQKKGAHRIANSAEIIRRGQEVGAVQKQKANNATGHSVTFATGSAAGERGGAEKSGGGHQMKGSMMFRQFSRRQQRMRTDGGTAQQQKI